MTSYINSNAIPLVKNSFMVMGEGIYNIFYWIIGVNRYELSFNFFFEYTKIFSW